MNVSIWGLRFHLQPSVMLNPNGTIISSMTHSYRGQGQQFGFEPLLQESVVPTQEETSRSSPSEPQDDSLQVEELSQNTSSPLWMTCFTTIVVVN